MNDNPVNGEARLPFAKIITCGEYGQVAMFAQRDGQGNPAIVLHNEVPEIGICSVTMTFFDVEERDEAWHKAPMAKIKSVIAQLYNEIEAAKAAANKPSIIMPPGLTH